MSFVIIEDNLKAFTGHVFVLSVCFVWSLDIRVFFFVIEKIGNVKVTTGSNFL